MSFRPGRLAGILIGAFVILGLGVYGPITLLAPLPEVHAEVLEPESASAGTTAAPALPADGASAVAIVGQDAPIAHAGIDDAVPIAGVAKVILALVSIDAKPLAVGAAGPGITITDADYDGYLDYAKADARAVAVFAGETWTEREVLQAVLLGSSNNHADTLARWAFGSVEDYLDAADAWLTAHGLTHTHVADATGLNEQTAGTASDAAMLVALVEQQPTLSEILHNPVTALVGGRGVSNVTDYFADEGVFGISRSFTDPAGVCFLFTMTAGEGADAVTIAGAFLREPDYDTLAADITAFVATSAAAAQQVPSIAAGTAYARFTTAWGQRADGIAGVDLTRSAWAPATDVPTVTTQPFSTKEAGSVVGHVRVTGADADIPLKLDAAIRDPGPGWRLLHPLPMIGSFLAANLG